MGMILVTASVAVFVWAVVGLIRPTWARLPSRAASVGVWGLSVVLFIIGAVLMPEPTPEQTELMPDSTPEQTEQDDVSYSIINSTATAGIKRSLDVRLNKRVAEDTLRALALKLKSQDSRDYDRTFITYYLPGMTVGAGAWATTHFRPDLEVKIWGLWTEEEKKLTPATRPAPAMGDVIRGGVHTESDFRVAVAQFFDAWPDEGDVVGARAVGNNLTVTMNWMGTRFLPGGEWTCEQEREIAEYFLENWKEDLRETTQDLPNTATDFDIGSGASITFTSLAGRVFASADESSTTPLCD